MIAAVVKGIVLGVLLAISVGPIIFSIIKQSIANGHKGGYFFVAGVSFSDILMVVVANLFTAIFQSAMEHEKIIGVVGSCFLLVLGVYTAFFKKAVLADPKEMQARVFKKWHLAGIFFSGFFMNIFNPGALLFWFAASATILADSKTEPHPIQYRIIVFATTLIFVLATDLLKVLLAGKIRNKLTVHNIHIINRISGFILIIFGCILAYGLVFRGAHVPHG